MDLDLLVRVRFGIGFLLLPDGLEGDVAGHGRVEVVVLAVELPALEGEAVLGGVLGLGRGVTVLDLLARHRGAAIRVEGDEIVRGLAAVITLFFPLGHEFHIGGRPIVLVDFLQIARGIRIVPARECVALIRRTGEFGELLALLDNPGLLPVGAVVKGERHRIGLCPLGIELGIDANGRRGEVELVAVRAPLVGVPALKGMALPGGIVGRGGIAALGHRLRCRSISIGTVEIKAHLERTDGLLLPDGDERQVGCHALAEFVLVDAVIPTDELKAVFGGRAGVGQLIAVVDRLGIHARLAIQRAAGKIERHLAGIDLPVGVQREVLGHVLQGEDRALRSARAALPALKGVAGLGGVYGVGQRGAFLDLEGAQLGIAVLAGNGHVLDRLFVLAPLGHQRKIADNRGVFGHLDARVLDKPSHKGVALERRRGKLADLFVRIYRARRIGIAQLATVGIERDRAVLFGGVRLGNRARKRHRIVVVHV